MALFDLLGRSWALGVIWQLADAGLTFRDLQERCEGISPTVLNRRLKELRECALVTHDGNGYRLTELGRDLFVLLEPFGAWSQDWSRTVFGTTPGQADASAGPRKD